MKPLQLDEAIHLEDQKASFRGIADQRLTSDTVAHLPIATKGKRDTFSAQVLSQSTCPPLKGLKHLFQEKVLLDMSDQDKPRMISLANCSDLNLARYLLKSLAALCHVDELIVDCGHLVQPCDEFGANPGATPKSLRSRLSSVGKSSFKGQVMPEATVPLGLSNRACATMREIIETELTEVRQKKRAMKRYGGLAPSTHPPPTAHLMDGLPFDFWEWWASAGTVTEEFRKLKFGNRKNDHRTDHHLGDRLGLEHPVSSRRLVGTTGEARIPDDHVRSGLWTLEHRRKHHGR